MKSDMAEMAILEHRLQTFLPGILTKKGWDLKTPRRKDAPTSQKLASSGFFFSPTPTHPHRVSCYLCGPIQTSHQDTNVTPDLKDVWTLHADTCALRMLMMDGLAWVAASKPKSKKATGRTLMPAKGFEPWGKVMTEARLKTFGALWPHRETAGWKCTAEKISEAGMYHKPTKDEPDYAECVYCDLGLAGWESEDDPWFEHQKRSSDCIIFQAPKDYMVEESGSAMIPSPVSSKRAASPVANGKAKEEVLEAEDGAKKPAKGRGRVAKITPQPSS
ncbi:hypothetical protein BC829DRAFT_253343 [Chytridium lagenaria]|nr:hypothetical protein BC829DRAFT_253343 [Chytridium lagenaria]